MSAMDTAGFVVDASMFDASSGSDVLSNASGDGATDADLTLALKVAYNGSSFCGFAKQPGCPTIQGSLEEALRTVFRHQVDTTCAGRTDSGVHALGQVVSFDIAREEIADRSFSNLLRSLNALTADGISVMSVIERPKGFSARFDAKARVYKYFFALAPFEPLFMEGFSWHTGSLHEAAMADASKHLLGEHDFKSFCIAKSAIDKPTCRYIEDISFKRRSILSDEVLEMTIVGNAFLHSMVRTIAGSLVDVGKGRRPAHWMLDVLEARDRKAAGQTAPAKGLVFWDVRY